MWGARSDYRVFFPVMALLVAGAWAALAVWSASPGAYLLSHENLGQADFGLNPRSVATAVAFVAGWDLMVVAMMLPTIIPLLLILRQAAGPARQTEVTAWAAFGYVAVWSAFGVLAHSADVLIHMGVASHAWLHANAWALGVAPLLLAGAYQFSGIKHICLDRCRSPFSFVAGRWSGSSPRRQSLHIGIQHGIFCLGCCWALMLLMFAVGAGNLAWMLLLAAVMGAEKNLPWGHRLTTPIGVVLLSSGTTLLVMNV